MAKNKIEKSVKVKPLSVMIIFLGIAVFLIFSILARFSVIDLTSQTSNYITLIGSIFLLSEISILALIRKAGRGKFVLIDSLIASVGILAILLTIANISGKSLGFFEPARRIVEIGLLIFILIEIFRKNN